MIINISMIYVSDHNCTMPKNPLNGYANCSRRERGMFCSFHCNAGYAYPLEILYHYYCLFDGEWLPDKSPLNFQDCACKNYFTFIFIE